MWQRCNMYSAGCQIHNYICRDNTLQHVYYPVAIGKILPSANRVTLYYQNFRNVLSARTSLHLRLSAVDTEQSKKLQRVLVKFLRYMQG